MDERDLGANILHQSGVASARHLKAAGVDVVVFERYKAAGGNWYYSLALSSDPILTYVGRMMRESPSSRDILQSNHLLQILWPSWKARPRLSEMWYRMEPLLIWTWKN